MNKVVSYMTLVTSEKSSNGLFFTLEYILSVIIFCLLVRFIIKKVKKFNNKARDNNNKKTKTL